MDTLFPEPGSRVLVCPDCDSEYRVTYRDISIVLDRFEQGCDCGTSLARDDLSFRDAGCRVCHEPVVDGRWSYCSERCRDIANAVGSMFNWDQVRQKVLERDDHACQQCGASETGSDGPLQVDHIDRVADGGHPFDERNLQTLCRSCHEAKTAAENRTADDDPAERPELGLDAYLDD